MRIAFLAIAAAGFGKTMPWVPEPSVGGRLTFAQSLIGTVDDFFVKLLTPDWALDLPIKRLRTGKAHYAAFEGRTFRCWHRLGSELLILLSDLREMIEERRQAIAEGVETYDLFTQLIVARCVSFPFWS